MITHAQERFEQDYKIFRKLVITGELHDGAKAKAWVKARGEAALQASEREIECSRRLRRMLSRPSAYQAAMDDYNDKKKNGEDD